MNLFNLFNFLNLFPLVGVITNKKKQHHQIAVGDNTNSGETSSTALSHYVITLIVPKYITLNIYLISGNTVFWHLLF
jgi:hypothetical protein